MSGRYAKVCERCEEEQPGAPRNVDEGRRARYRALFDEYLCDPCYDERCDAWGRHGERREEAR